MSFRKITVGTGAGMFIIGLSLYALGFSVESIPVDHVQVMSMVVAMAGFNVLTTAILVGEDT